MICPDKRTDEPMNECGIQTAQKMALLRLLRGESIKDNNNEMES